MAPKMRNLLGGAPKTLIKSKDTQNKKNKLLKPTQNKKKETAKETQNKKKETRPIKQTVTTSSTVEVKKKRGRPPKIKEPLLTTTTTTQKITSKPTLKTVTQSIKPITQKVTNTISEWNNSTQIQPDEFRPVIFNTLKKKLVTGYKVGHGYVISTPYEVDKFKKKFGYIEWQYVPNCTNLKRCSKEFPDCANCKQFKKGS